MCCDSQSTSSILCTIAWLRQPSRATYAVIMVQCRKTNCYSLLYGLSLWLWKNMKCQDFFCFCFYVKHKVWRYIFIVDVPLVLCPLHWNWCVNHSLLSLLVWHILCPDQSQRAVLQIGTDENFKDFWRGLRCAWEDLNFCVSLSCVWSGFAVCHDVRRSADEETGVELFTDIIKEQRWCCSLKCVC